MISREDFITAALMCVGTPVVHMGRVAGQGLDCAGLVWAACELCGIPMAKTLSYGPLPNGSTLTAGLEAFADRCDSLSGSHVLQVFVGREPRHVVIPIAFDGGRIEIVHAWGKHAKVCRSFLTDRVHAGWRLRGVE